MALQLLPVLRADLAPDRKDVKSWSTKLETACRKLVARLLPLESRDMEFLTLLNDRGEIAAELLTGDTEMQRTIRSHPGLRWKAQNVREHLRQTGRRSNRANEHDPDDV